MWSCNQALLWGSLSHYSEDGIKYQEWELGLPIAVGESLILDLTYEYKTDKQGTYNQRHLNKEQTDSNQREGKGVVGERRGWVSKEHV